VLRVTGPKAPPATVREAAPADLPAVQRLVAEAGLPLDGLTDAAVVLVAEAGDAVVGTVSLERHGPGPYTTFLLRSATVERTWRGHGVGAALVAAALACVDTTGGQVALLTETAADWFPRFGFAPVDRTSLPPELDGSAELQGACPASAQAMLRPPSRG
jgi:amino-acid N-acetyltransferase